MIYRAARIILMMNSFLMLIYGLIVIIKPNLFTDNLEVFTGLSMDELYRTSRKLVQYIDMVIMLNGGLNIVIGSVGIVATYKSFKIRARWLLLIIFITNILGYLIPVIFDQITGVIRYPEIIEIISFVLALGAFLILLREKS